MRDKLAEKPKLAIEVAIKTTGMDGLNQTAFRGSALARAYGKSLDAVGEASEKVGKKGTSALDSMTGKMKGLQNTTDDFRGAWEAIIGLGISGAIGGLTWSAADKSENVLAGASAALKAKKFDMEKVNSSVASLTDSGLTGSSDQIKLITGLSNAGLKDKATAIKASEQLTRGYMNNADYLESMGYGNADAVMGTLTTARRFKKGTNAAQEMDALARTMGYEGKKDFSQMSQSQREKAISKFKPKNENGSDATDEDIRQKNLDRVVQTRLSNLSKSIGKTMLGPMDVLLLVFEKIILVINAIPGAPGLLAILATVIGLTSAGLAFAAVIPSASAGLEILGKISGKTAVQTAAVAAAQATEAVTAASTVPANAAAGASATAASGGFWAMAAGIWAAISPLLIIIVPLLALGALLYLVESRTHIFSKALKTLGKTEMARDLLNFFKDCGYQIRVAIGLVDSLYKALKKGGASKFIMDMVGGELSFLGEEGNELLEFVTTLLKKAVGFLEWLWNAIQTLSTWLKNGLGITKADKKTKMEDLADDAGVHWEEAKGNRPAGWWKDNVQASRPGSGVSESTLNKLNKAREDWQKAPGGFFDGIPGISDLTDAIKTLTDALKNPVDAAKKAKDDVTNWGDAKVAADADRYNAVSQDKGEYVAAQTTWRPWWMPKFNAIGASIKTKGIAGLDPGEEVVPAAQTTRGPGAIARALDALDKNGSSGAVGGGKSEIHNHYYTIDASQHIEKVSSEVDVNQMSRVMTSKLDEIFSRKSRQAGN